jgi:hypothetical protein
MFYIHFFQWIMVASTNKNCNDENIVLSVDCQNAV